VGTIRDAQKWPVRDKRKDKMKIDQVNFNLLSPYTISKMFEGREILRKLKKESADGTTSYSYNSMRITGNSLERGIELYQTGINKFLGNSLIKRLEKTDFTTDEQLRERLAPDSKLGSGEWVDLAGLIAPKSEVEKLLDAIESGKVNTVQGLSESFIELHRSYYNWEWAWACERIEEETGITVNKITAVEIIEIVRKWKKSVVDLDMFLYEDARKEFTLSSMTGFGIDGGDEVKKLDFENVRGEFESNPVVAAIREHIRQKSALADELTERMKRVNLQAISPA
jgi:hypothetical protein